MTIRTWLKVADGSTGSVAIGTGTPIPFGRVQGGFLGKVVVSTQNLLAPLKGPITLEDARIATEAPGTFIGDICVWGNPDVPSTGQVVLDILGGNSSATLTLNVRATTQLAPDQEVDLSQSATFDLGSGLSIQTLLNAANNGTADGLFATEASFTGTTQFGPFPATFALNVNVTNDSAPPEFDTDLLEFCGPYFAEQGNDLFYGLNSKSSYLLANNGDSPKPPLVIDLDKLGAAPGSTLHLARIGSFSSVTQLKDGSLGAITGVFSSTDTVLGTDQLHRVPGAIDAGADIVTPKVTRCFFIFCSQTASDVPEDFKIDPTVDVTVPAGAHFLIVAPLPPDMVYGDDSGFGFGVSAEVL